MSGSLYKYELKDPGFIKEMILHLPYVPRNLSETKAFSAPVGRRHMKNSEAALPHIIDKCIIKYSNHAKHVKP